MNVQIWIRLLTAGLAFWFVGTAALAEGPVIELFDEFASPVSRYESPVSQYESSVSQYDRTADVESEVRQLQEQLDSLTGLYNNLYDRIESQQNRQLDIELTSLKRRLDSPDGCFSDSCGMEFLSDCCNDVSDSCCEPCCARCGLYAGFALVWIRPHF